MPSQSGGRTVSYTYDDLYRLTSESIANDPHGVNGTASYNYDPVGNRLNRFSSIALVPSQSSTYDPNDRLTSDSYDNNGNTTAANGNSYGYDFENLTSLNGGSVSYVWQSRREDCSAIPLSFASKIRASRIQPEYRRYRVKFAKPYNLRVLRELSGSRGKIRRLK